jgi:hypothetical protein
VQLRAEEEHRASPTSPLEAISAASDGSPDVHMQSHNAARHPGPPPRYAPYQPLKPQTGGHQQPNGLPPMRTKADILSEDWGQEAGGAATFSVQGGQDGPPVDPMQVIRQLSQGRTSPAQQQQDSAPAPSYETAPQYAHQNEYTAGGPAPMYGQSQMYPDQQHYTAPPNHSAGSYQSSQPISYPQPQAGAYAGYPSNYLSSARVQTAASSLGPQPSAYAGQVYPSAQYPPQQQSFSQQPPSAYPGYYASSAAAQGYKQPSAMYPGSQQGYSGSAPPQQYPGSVQGFTGASQTYPQGGGGQFVLQQRGGQPPYGAQQEMGADQYGWQGQYLSSGQNLGERYYPNWSI